MDLKLVAASILLVLLCSEVSSYHLQKREAQEKKILTQLQEKAEGVWTQVSTTARGWLDQIKALDVTDKVRDFFQQGVSALNTYSGIVTDQISHIWQSDQ